MNHYLLLVHMVEGEGYPSEEEMQQAFKDVEVLNDDLRKAGVWVFAGGLETPETATVVREEKGNILTTDGPFVEGKEHIGGFWVIKVADLDAALDWAKKATVACRGAVEVRRPERRERQFRRRRLVGGNGSHRETRQQSGAERKCPTRYGGPAPRHTL